MTAFMADAAGAAKTERAVFAGGCFWCMQPFFDNTPGVVSTLVGYTGGSEEAPTYEQVSSHRTGHREAIEVVYDPAVVGYKQLLQLFWRNIDPTQEDGQFADRGHHYTTAIFYTSAEQEREARASKEALEQSGKFSRPIATAILPASKFWPAEEYHQKFYLKSRAHYEAYKEGSGRAGYIRRNWGGGH